MTEHEQHFAEQVAKHLAHHMPVHSCLFSDDDRAELKWLCQTIRDCRKAGARGVIMLLIGGIATLILLGVLSFLEGSH